MKPCERCGDPVRLRGTCVKFCSRDCADAAHRKPRALCAWCHEEPVKMPGRKYCSRECAGKGWADIHSGDKVRQKCAWCPKWFSPQRKMSGRPPQKYCSKPCAMKARSITMPDSHWSKMHALSKQAREAKREARWDENTAGLTPGEAARKFYFKGYQAGWRAARVSKRKMREAA